MATTYGDHGPTYADWGTLYGEGEPPEAGELCWQVWASDRWTARMGECLT